jgi:hypothetical protein
VQHLDMADAALLRARCSCGPAATVHGAGTHQRAGIVTPTSRRRHRWTVAFLELLSGNANKSAPRSYSQPMMQRCRRYSIDDRAL